MKTAFIFLVLTVLELFRLAIHTSAQSLSVDRFVVAGGGGSGSGGVFELNATVGQPDATAVQPLTGGSFSLVGGFWSAIAIQTPGAPQLFVERLGTTVRILWSAPAPGFVLEHSPTTTGPWSQVSFPYVTNSATISRDEPAAAGKKFYRLRRL